MMATFQQGQNMHPGMQPGHPGMVPNPQMMGQPMQMHPGVSAPPHVSQAGAMMGLQPGAAAVMQAGGMAGPLPTGMPMGRGMAGQAMPGMPGAAQAVGHLNPQAQMLQQQALQAGQNPAMFAQMQAQQQQRILQQRQLQLQAQQMGINPNDPQAMARMMQNVAANPQFHGNQPVQLPAHMVQQQQILRQQQATQAQQQQAQQVQAAQQQQQAQQQHAAAQAVQQQQQQQQQQLAMQHVNSQQSNPPTTSQPGPAPQPPQVRPQSRLSTAAEQASANVNQQANTPSNQSQVQSQTPQQQNAAQMAQQQANSQGQQPGQQMTQQQQQIAFMQQQQKLRMQMQQQQVLNRQATVQAQAGQQGQLSGQSLLRLMQFADHLGSFTQQDGNDMSNWHSFVDRHFAADGRLVLQLYELKNRQIEILRATLPRYFWMYFETGAKCLRLHIEGIQTALQPDGRHRVNCNRAILSVSYPNGARAELSGPLSVLFAPQDFAMEALEFQMSTYDEHISRIEVERVLSTWSPTMSSAKSPKMTKKNAPKAQQKAQGDTITIDAFPKAPKSQCGMSMRMYQFLEISETMSLMQDLMHFSQDKSLRPAQAVEAIAGEYDRQAQTGGAQQMVNGGTPRMMKMSMPQGQAGFVNSSPNLSNMNLPMQNGVMNGSPHFANLNAPAMPGQMGMTASPAQTHMAPPMMPQHSQQGTNSSTVSADTSPQVNNKRRRSTVKVEEEGGGGESKIKPSPRMGKKAKPS